MNFPLWFVLLLGPVYVWPFTLALAVIAGVAAVLTRGRARLVVGIAAAILALPGLFGAVLEVKDRLAARRAAADYAAAHTVLDADTVLDGVALPAGTALTWTDRTRQRWYIAEMPVEVVLRGVPTRGVTRRVGEGDDAWTLMAERPVRIGDWPCAAGTVDVGASGDLLECQTSEAVDWRGWRLPEGTMVRSDPRERTIGLVLPTGTRLEAPEIGGRPMPTNLTLNADGSLAGTLFYENEPLVVAGTGLWGNITWRYDPATDGRGRDRPAVAVVGTAIEGGRQVAVRLPDGAVTSAWEGR